MSTITGRGWASDVLLAAGLTIVSLAAAAAQSAWGEPPRPADAVGYGLIVVACGVIAIRRLLPATVLVISALSVSAFLALGYPYGFVIAALVIAVYTVARRGPTWRALLLSAAAFVCLSAHVFVNPAALPGLFGLIPTSAFVALPATVGIARRSVVEARARERAETERRLRDEERLRLAHEVHDVVGHGLAAIRMQADIALHVAESRPEQGLQALRAISSASAAALDELRDALGSVAPGDADAPRTPAASLDRLDALAGRIRAAGVDVQLTVTGEPRRLPSAVDLAAYRIAQESLTNVVKHAVSPRVTVELAYGADAVTLSVASPHDGSAIHEGFGLRGIRRRVASLGGTISIRAGDTLHLRAVLPATI